MKVTRGLINELVSWFIILHYYKGLWSAEHSKGLLSVNNGVLPLFILPLPDISTRKQNNT